MGFCIPRGSFGARITRRHHRFLVTILCIGIALQSLPSAQPSMAAEDQYLALRSQLDSLVAERATMLHALDSSDSTVGALLAQVMLGSLQAPLRSLATLTAQSLKSAEIRKKVPTIIRTKATLMDRISGPGLLAGPHLPLTPITHAPPKAALSSQAVSWGQLLLNSTALQLTTGPFPKEYQPSPVSLSAGAYLSPIQTSVPTVGTQVTYQSLGAAQSAQPLRSVLVEGNAVPLPKLAPQVVEVNPPVSESMAPTVASVQTAKGLEALAAYVKVTRGLDATLGTAALPSTIPNPRLSHLPYVTNLADVQSSLGHFSVQLAPKSGLNVGAIVPAVSSQLGWSFTATTPLAPGRAVRVSGNGHADSAALHDVQLTASTIAGSFVSLNQAPQTTVDFDLSPTGVGDLTAVSVLSDTTVITTTVSVNSVLFNTEVQNALAQERLDITELSGVLTAGNAVYARTLPLYQAELSQYQQQLGGVLARNQALQQTWWARRSAYDNYVKALNVWRKANSQYLAYQESLRSRTLSSPTAVAPQASTAQPTTNAVVTAVTPAPTTVSQQINMGGTNSDRLSTSLAAIPPALSLRDLSPTPIVTPNTGPAVQTTPLFGSTIASPTLEVPPTFTATEGPPTATPTSPASETASTTATQPISDSATSSASPTPTTSETQPAAVGSATMVTATVQILATSSVSPTATVTEPTSTPAPLGTPAPPPGSPPPPVAPPGLEPRYEALPAPVPPLPNWAAASPPPLSLGSSSVMPNPNAAGASSFTADQLLAYGVLGTGATYVPPLQGVITTFWGGSTPWQSFHTGVDIAAPQYTPVHAAAAGIVVYAGLAVPGDPTSSYGNCVIIMHNNHVSTLYGHMDLLTHGLAVGVGQVVQQGQVIGYEGSTGWATGPHVHFEIRYNNIQFDPLLVVNEHQITG